MFLWTLGFREAIIINFIRYLMHDYHVNTRFRFGIIPEFDAWLAQLLYLRAVKTNAGQYIELYGGIFLPRDS